MGIILSLAIGALIGYIAGQFTKGSGFGLIGNIIVGLLGGLFGSVIFTFLGISAQNFVGEIICGVIGAILLLFLIKQIKNRR